MLLEYFKRFVYDTYNHYAITFRRFQLEAWAYVNIHVSREEWYKIKISFLRFRQEDNDRQEQGVWFRFTYLSQSLLLSRNGFRVGRSQQRRGGRAASLEDKYQVYWRHHAGSWPGLPWDLLASSGRCGALYTELRVCWVSLLGYRHGGS